MLNRTAEREIRARDEKRRAAEIAAQPPKSTLIPGAAPRSGPLAGNPRYAFKGYSPLPNGRRAPVYERTTPPDPALSGWGKRFTAFTNQFGRAALRKLRAEKGSKNVREDNAVLKEFFALNGIPDPAVEIHQLTQPAGSPMFGAKAAPAPTAPTPKPTVKLPTAGEIAFAQLNALKAAGKWGAACQFIHDNRAALNTVPAFKNRS